MTGRHGDDLERRDPPDLYERIAVIVGADPDGSERELCDVVEARMVELRDLRALMELWKDGYTLCPAEGELRTSEEGAALDLDGPESGPYTHVFTVGVCLDCGSEILPGAGRCLHCEHSNDAEADLIEADPDPGDLTDGEWTAEWAPTIAQIKAGNLSEIEGWIGDADPDDTVEVPAAVLQALLRQIRPVEPAGAAK